MIQCSDYSRNIFITKNSDGNIVKDINCRNLCDIIEPIATKKANQLFTDDFNERSKFFEIQKLEKSMKDRENKIHSLHATSKGFKTTSAEFRDYMRRIHKEEKQNEADLIQYYTLKNSGVKPCSDIDFIDVKLSTAIDDIQELKTNPSVFSKNLSQYI
jgi:hypothetical protein